MLTDPAHNTINIGAVMAPVVSFFIQASPILTGLLAVAGLVWYGVLFYDRFVKKQYPSNEI